MVTSLVSKCNIQMVILSGCKSPHIGSWTCRVRAIVAEKAVWKPPKLSSLAKRATLGGVAGNSATLRVAEDTGLVVSIMGLFSNQSGPCKNWMDHGG